MSDSEFTGSIESSPSSAFVADLPKEEALVNQTAGEPANCASPTGEADCLRELAAGEVVVAFEGRMAGEGQVDDTHAEGRTAGCRPSIRMIGQRLHRRRRTCGVAQLDSHVERRRCAEERYPIVWERSRRAERLDEHPCNVGSTELEHRKRQRLGEWAVVGTGLCRRDRHWQEFVEPSNVDCRSQATRHEKRVSVVATTSAMDLEGLAEKRRRFLVAAGGGGE